MGGKKSSTAQAAPAVVQTPVAAKSADTPIQRTTAAQAATAAGNPSPQLLSGATPPEGTAALSPEEIARRQAAAGSLMTG